MISPFGNFFYLILKPRNYFLFSLISRPDNDMMKHSTKQSENQMIQNDFY